MFFARRCPSCCNTIRGFASAPKNHYDSLGVKSTATHSEIKTAYYEMSKLYHPDTNKGSDESLTKFRQVTDAYEVLGNVKSRRMYDRGLVVGGGGTVLREDDEDDPQTRFYKRRERRTHVPTTTDRTTVYDFDAWTRAHYFHTKDRLAYDRARYDKRTAARLEIRRRRDVQRLVVGCCVFALLYLSIFSILFSESYDKVQIDYKKKAKKDS